MSGLLGLTSMAGAGWVSALWQGCVLAAAVALGLRWMPRLSAAARSALWLGVFLLLVGIQIAPLLWLGEGGAFASSPVVMLDARWGLALGALWILFSAIRLAQLAAGMVRLRGMAARAVEVVPSETVARMLRLGNGRRVRLCLSTDVERPCVLGFWSPTVLLPPVLMEALTAEEMELVLAHEMEHLRRADDWSNLAQKLALALFPLNPALVWVEKKICAERELACDDQALRIARGPKAYALCLARLAEFSRMRGGLALALGAWERRPELVRRIERIVSCPARVLGGRLAWGGAAALMVGALALAASLARTPAVVGFALKPSHVLQAQVSMKQSLPAASPLAVQALPVKEAAAVRAAARPAKVQAEAPAMKASAVAAPQEATLLVLTSLEEFQEPAHEVYTRYDELEMVPHVIFAVEHLPRGRYAAVPVLGGWLIVQI